MLGNTGFVVTQNGLRFMTYPPPPFNDREPRNQKMGEKKKTFFLQSHKKKKVGFYTVGGDCINYTHTERDLFHD